MGALSNSVDELRTNDQQWEAFTSTGHCVVLAPPGSGKTKLLTTRMAFDLVNNIPPPHGVACITLTNSAADELRRRIDRLGVPRRSTQFVGTVHSFALQRVLTPFAAAVGRPELAKISIASSVQVKQAFSDAIRAVYTEYDDKRNVESTVEYLRQRFAADDEWQRSGPKIRQVAQRYTAALREQDLYDFQDIVEYAVDLVENHRLVRQILSARYPYLYVDEYQDLAPGLDRLVRALCFEHEAGSQLFAVGDPDQSVMAFTGARPELLHELPDRPGVTAVHLEQNYRCGAEIIRVANLIRRGSTPVTGTRPGGAVSATECRAGFTDQSQHAAASIREARDRGVPLHEIALICPTNALCEQATTILRAQDVAAFVRGSEYRPVVVKSNETVGAYWTG